MCVCVCVDGYEHRKKGRKKEILIDSEKYMYKMGKIKNW